MLQLEDKLFRDQLIILMNFSHQCSFLDDKHLTHLSIQFFCMARKRVQIESFDCTLGG